MNDKDHSIDAASRPHCRHGDSMSARDDHSRDTTLPNKTPPHKKKPLWSRIRSRFSFRAPFLREDLEEALGTPALDGTQAAFSDGERTLIQNVLQLSETRVDDVMVNRADIEAAEIDDSISVLIASFRSAGHSRLPVFDDSLDNIVGMVHIKDLLLGLSEPVEAEGKNTQPEKLKSGTLRVKITGSGLLRDVLFVPPAMPVSTLLQSMQATRIHMAIVVDEYGGTDGLVTIEDLIEEVVGEIEDEHDEVDDIKISALDENTFIVDARCKLEDVAYALGEDFDPGDYAGDIDTLGGLITSLLDRVPVRGEIVTRLGGFDFEIVHADPRRVHTIRITRSRRALRQLQRKNKIEGRAGNSSAKKAAG